MDTLSKSKIKEEVENLREEIDQQTKFIYNIRRRYEKLVDKLYQLEPPFPQPRSGSEEERNSDIKQIYQITKHCVISDKTKLLKKYVIDPVYSKELSMRSEIIGGLNLLIERRKEQPKAQYYLKWTRKKLEKKLGK